jgi:hypothetical protein
MWYLPYLWSLLLFGIALFIFFNYPVRNPIPQSSNPDGLLSTTTILQKDTVYLIQRDTVFIFGFYPPTGNSGLPTSSSFSHTASNGAILSYRDSDEGPSIVTSTAPGTSPNADQQSPFTPVSNDPNNKLVPAEQNSGPLAADTTQNTNAVVQQDTSDSFQSDPLKERNGQDTGDLAATIAPPETEEKPEKTKRKSSIGIHAGPVIQTFLPIGSNNLDRYSAIFGGLEAGLALGRAQLITGIQFGTLIHEFDDIDEIPQNQINRFPGYATLPEEPENIEVKSNHRIIPLSLGYTVLDKGKITVIPRVGALLNLITRERLYYIFDEEEPDPIVVPTDLPKQWKTSHLILGTAVSFKLRPVMHLSLEPLFQLPLTSLGGTDLSYSTLSLQLKLSWMLRDAKK